MPWETTPVIPSSSSDAEEQDATESHLDPEPAQASPEPHSGASDGSGLAPPTDEESEGENDESSEGEDESSDNDNDDDDDEEDEDDSAEDSSEEVENALREPDQVDVADLCRKGGDDTHLTARQIRDLILMAIPPLEGEQVPPLNVREWTFHDIASLPNTEREEWFNACYEELEALCDGV